MPHLGRCLEQRPHIHIEAQIRESRGDHLGPAVMAILAHLGHQDPGPPPLPNLEVVNGPGHGQDVLRLSVLCPVGPGHEAVGGHVAAKHPLHGLGDLTHCTPRQVSSLYDTSKRKLIIKININKCCGCTRS